jgi:phosphoglycerate dehydrogenase-like enzyme
VKHILIDMPVHAASLERLRALPEVAVEVLDPADEARELPVATIADKHVLFCSIPPTNVADMAALEFVQIGSVGYSQLYGLGLEQRGVRACNARGVFDVPIAEWNIAMMIALLRDLRGMIRNQEQGVWDRSARFQQELRGRTVGLWGYGGIGRETARLAQALGMRVHACARRGVGPRTDTYRVPGTGDPEGKLPDAVFTAGQELEFLSGVDFLVLAMPLTPESEGIVGERELQALPEGAYILNPARGPLIQEAALLEALRSGRLGGAALDTHYHYPMPADHPLWQFPNVIMTPHISGSSAGTHFPARVWDVFVQNVARLLAGEPLLNELSREQLAGH